VISFNTSRYIPPYVSVELCLLISQYCVIILGFHSHLGSRDSIVGIATHYGLDDLGIEYQWGRDFPHLSRLALRPTKLPIQWALGLPQR
jgi:hypothetical protein